VAFLVAGMLHPGLFENENDEHRLPKQSVICLAFNGLPVCALGSLIQYLASNQIDAKRHSVVFTVLSCLSVHEACLYCVRGVEDEDIKGMRDYYCLVDNMMIIAGEARPSEDQMDEADDDLAKKHLASDRAMYGRLRYIILIGTAGRHLKLNAMSISPGSVLQEVLPAMEVRGCRLATRTWKDVMLACAQHLLVQDGNQQVQAMCTIVLLLYIASFHFSITELQVTSPTNRQKALLMFINLVRWVRTVHEQHVLPVHRHQLFRNMPRRSPYPGQCGSSCNVPCYGAAALHFKPHPLRMSCSMFSLLFS